MMLKNGILLWSLVCSLVGLLYLWVEKGVTDRLLLAYVLDVFPLDVALECQDGSFEIIEDILKFCIDGVLNQLRCEVAVKNIQKNHISNNMSYDLKLDLVFQDNPNTFIVSQIHALPDKNEQWRCPPFSFDVSNSKYSVINRWDLNEITKNGSACSSSDSSIQSRMLFSPHIIQVQEWNHIDFNLQSSRLTGEGKAKVVFNEFTTGIHLGPNTYNDNRPPYFKFGVYRQFSWKEPKNRVCVEFKNIKFSADEAL